MSKTIKTLQISGKVSDMCAIQAYGLDGEFIGEYDGYVPAFQEKQDYGDYLDLEIDVLTGVITNWPKVLKTDAGQAILRRDLKLSEDDQEEE